MEVTQQDYTWQMCKQYASLFWGLKHLWILVSVGSLGTSALQVLGTVVHVYFPVLSGEPSRTYFFT
jgi:hypothetical protein